MSDEAKAALKAMMDKAVEHIDSIAKLGAQEVGFGFLNDLGDGDGEVKTIAEMDWWARAKFGGRDYFVEHHMHPLAALQALDRQLQVERPKRSVSTFTPEQGTGKLEDKVPGRHRWIATAVHALTPGQVQNVHMKNRVNLDHKSLLDIFVGCVDCEQMYDPETRTQPCEAEEYQWQTQS